MKKIPFLLALALLPFLSAGQKIPKPNTVQLSFSPGLGFMHFENPLSLNQALLNKSNELRKAPSPLYAGNYGTNRALNQANSSYLAFTNLQVLLGWDQKSSKTGKVNSRFELGLSYQTQPGRRSFYTNAAVNSYQFTSDTTLLNHFYSYEEVFDLVSLVTRYQVRVSAEDAKNNIYIGLSARIGTELLNKDILVTVADLEYIVLPEVSGFVYNEQKYSFESRRGAYLSFLVPITYERQLSNKWLFSSSVSIGWGVVEYSELFTYRNEKFRTSFVDFGLRYQL